MPHSNIACCPSVCLQRKLTTLKRPFTNCSISNHFFQRCTPVDIDLKMYLLLVFSVTRQPFSLFRSHCNISLPFKLQYFTMYPLISFYSILFYIINQTPLIINSKIPPLIRIFILVGVYLVLAEYYISIYSQLLFRS